MDAWLWIVIVVAVVAAIVLVSVMMARRASHARRREALRERFGPEYDRTVERGGRRRGEAALVARTRRREQFQTRPLTAAAYERYTGEWRDVQARFVDQPAVAVAEAEALVGRVMRDRGYPVAEGDTQADFDTQTDLISVDHPGLVQNYRAAHRIHERSRQHLADTDELRQALLHYRSLFDELLVRAEARQDDTGAGTGATSDDEAAEEALEARFGETPEERAADLAAERERDRRRRSA